MGDPLMFWPCVLHTPDFGIYDSKRREQSSPVFGKNCVFIHDHSRGYDDEPKPESKGTRERDLFRQPHESSTLPCADAEPEASRRELGNG